MDYLQKVTKADLVTVEMKRLFGKGDSLMPHQIAAMLGIRSEEAL